MIGEIDIYTIGGSSVIINVLQNDNDNANIHGHHGTAGLAVIINPLNGTMEIEPLTGEIINILQIRKDETKEYKGYIYIKL